MSADLLRRAATTLREHAQALPGTMVGPWFVRSGNVIADDGTDVGILAIAPYSPTDDGPLMAFIALVHPPAVLALAVVLDDWADQLDRRLAFNIPATDVSEPLIAHLIDVARAILREVP